MVLAHRHIFPLRHHRIHHRRHPRYVSLRLLPITMLNQAQKEPKKLDSTFYSFILVLVETHLLL